MRKMSAREMGALRRLIVYLVASTLILGGVASAYGGAHVAVAAGALIIFAMRRDV